MAYTSENEIADAVLRILDAQPNGRASVRKIIREVPNYIRLDESDHSHSFTRSGEEIWEQRVRNLKSHSTTSGNIFHEGYVEHVTRGVWAITPVGKWHIEGSA